MTESANKFCTYFHNILSNKNKILASNSIKKCTNFTNASNKLANFTLVIYIPSHLSSASSEKKEKGKKKKRNLQQQKSTLPTSLPSKSPRLSKERNTITFREATRKARKSSGSSCWLASGSWPADSAINHYYTSSLLSTCNDPVILNLS